ncbi:MBL fold metallo-hydrolase [bacterium]|nr:MBL fold metallo-hydrolase [bacterium]
MRTACMKLGVKIFLFLISFLSLAELFEDFSCGGAAIGRSSADLSVHFIDVGYGDSVFIEFPGGENMLIDGGGRAGGANVAEYLKDRGVRKLDMVVITHPHPDHMDGIFTVMEKFKIESVLANEDIEGSENYSDFFKAVKRENVKFSRLRRGGIINKFKGVKLQILHPDKLAGNPNNDSLVIKLTYKKVSFLFPADIGGPVCDRLAQEFKEELRSNVLIVPHHGKSGTEKFFKAVSPEIAVISVGQSKWRDIPRENETRNKLEEMGVTVLSTDQQGTIVIQSDGEKVWK